MSSRATNEIIRHRFVFGASFVAYGDVVTNFLCRVLSHML